MTKEYKCIRYSVKFFPDGKITCYELKNSITSSREVEKEIIKNDEYISNIHDDMYGVRNENLLEKNLELDECQALDKKDNLENALLNQKIISRAINRTRNTVFDIVYSNEWTFFATFTFNKNKVSSRYDYNEVSKKLRKFLNNYRNLFDSNFKYIIIPEKHKDGAYHFHGFIYVTNESYFIDSGHKTLGKIGDTVYNWTKYNFGWNSFSYIQNKEKCCRYILKYITKQLFLDNDFCKRKFSCSANCIRPIKQTFETFDLSEFNLKYENDFVKIFEYISNNS